jgi:hypothetical protein
MKKYVILLLLTSFFCVKTLGQDANCEVEYLNAYQPMVYPYNEAIFCKKTKLFMKEQKLLKKVKWNAFGQLLTSYLVETDSLGKVRSIYHNGYHQFIEARYAEKILKHFLWDISMMKVKEFHDADNVYEIHLDVTVNRKRKVEIAASAYGKYATDRNMLCE